MSGDLSVWAYPWDLHDLGLDEATAQMGELGVNMLSLATSYHAGRFLQPGNPRGRVYFPEDDSEMLVGSRKRWITPKDDNCGFARWCHEHKDELFKVAP